MAYSLRIGTMKYPAFGSKGLKAPNSSSTSWKRLSSHIKTKKATSTSINYQKHT